MRLHPLLKIWKLHDGTDFAAACGTAIRAPYAGVVARIYFNPAYGNRLFLNHGSVDGVRVKTAFNHASRYLVEPGQRVTRGQVIGKVGNTGLSTGCHLHLMVWLNGRLSNPMSWL
jgi:murein DD-endopeptidase MepM/ murein hydrolase activator NlpD